MPLTKSTIEERIKIQNMVGRFILQVPSSTSRVLGWIDAGLIPIQFRILDKSMTYLGKVLHEKQDVLLLDVLQEVLKAGTQDIWGTWVINQVIKAGISLENMTLMEVRGRIKHMAMLHVLDVKREHSTMAVVPQPQVWFKLQRHVNDSLWSKVINCARGGNMGLENRMKNRLDEQYKTCPLCEDKGIIRRLKEAHVLFGCSVTGFIRRNAGIPLFVRKHISKDSPKAATLLLRLYLGGDHCDQEEIMGRAKALSKVVEEWFSAVERRRRNL